MACAAASVCLCISSAHSRSPCFVRLAQVVGSEAGIVSHRHEKCGAHGSKNQRGVLEASDGGGASSQEGRDNGVQELEEHNPPVECIENCVEFQTSCQRSGVDDSNLMAALSFVCKPQAEAEHGWHRIQAGRWLVCQQETADPGMSTCGLIMYVSFAYGAIVGSFELECCDDGILTNLDLIHYHTSPPPCSPHCSHPRMPPASDLTLNAQEQ